MVCSNVWKNCDCPSRKYNNKLRHSARAGAKYFWNFFGMFHGLFFGTEKFVQLQFSFELVEQMEILRGKSGSPGSLLILM